MSDTCPTNQIRYYLDFYCINSDEKSWSFLLIACCCLIIYALTKLIKGWDKRINKMTEVSVGATYEETYNLLSY